MKKWGWIIALFLLITIFLPSNIVTARAESEEGEVELNQTIEELLQSLDLQELQAYLDGLEEFEGVSLKEKLQSVLSGDFGIDYSNLFQSALNLIWEELRSLLPAFAVILAVALLCGILNSNQVGILGDSMAQTVDFVGYVAVGSVVFASLFTVFQTGYSAMKHMQTQMELVYPILLTLMAGSGGAVSVAVYRPAVAFLSSVICNLFTAVVLPIAVVIVILSFIGSLSPEVKTDKLSDFFKGISKWTIGLSLGLFSLFLTVQGLTSAQYDGLSLRAAKYALSNSVPIVGGFLSGGVEVVLAGSAILKNALGSYAVFTLFTTLLRPLVLLIVFQLFLRLSAAATDPVGGKISTFLAKMASDTGYFIAGLLCVAFLYFMTLILLICSSGVIF